MPGQKVNITSLAREIGVSPSTVSYALSGKRPISPELKQRINAAAEKLGYNPSQTAAALRTGKTGTCGLVLGNMEDMFHAEFASLAIKAAQARGYQFLIMATEWDQGKEVQALRTLRARNVEGIFYIPKSIRFDEELYQELRGEKLPIMLYDFQMEDLSSVSLDASAGIEGAMAELGKRHREVYVWLSPWQYADKSGILTEAAAQHGIRVIFRSSRFRDTSQLAGEIRDELVAAQRNSAVICFSPDVSTRLCPKLMQAGLRIPEDVEVISFGDIGFCRDAYPSISAVAFDLPAIIDTAADYLMGGEVSKPLNRVFPTRYIKRGSTLS